MHSEQELWKYVDGVLGAAEAASITAAAREDETLQARIDELRAIKGEVLAGTPAPPPDFAERVAAMAAAGHGRELAPVIDLDEARRYLRRMLVAAAILGAIGMAYLFLGWLPDVLEPSPIQAGNRLLGGN